VRKTDPTNRSDSISRRTALKKGLVASSALAVGAPTLSGTAAAASIVVPSDYDTIQAAVNDASSGDTVVVDGNEGPYREQVLVNKDLTLQGQNDPTIEALDSLSTYTIAESLSTWAPMVFAYGGSVSSGTVSGSGTIDVDVSGFTFDGRGDRGQSGRKTALLYRNVRGGSSASAVTDNDVVNMNTPDDTIGIVAYGDSDVVVEDNTLSEFGRGGVGANGDGGAHPSPTMVVRNNVIDSESAPGGSAPNGVQIGFGASGEVKDNTIRNCRFAEDIDGLF